MQVLNPKRVVSFNILIAERQFLIKQGLKAVIGEKTMFHLTDEDTGEPSHWLESIRRHKPDIFITDHKSFADIKEDLYDLLREISIYTKILIISDDQTPASIRKVIDAGIKGFLTKHCKPAEIRDALLAISRNNRFFCQEVMNTLIDSESVERKNANLSQLSEREYEVLSLIGKGHTSREISEMLFISIHTVNSHRKNLLRKLDMKSPAQLIVYALEHT